MTTGTQSFPITPRIADPRVDRLMAGVISLALLVLVVIVTALTARSGVSRTVQLVVFVVPTLSLVTGLLVVSVRAGRAARSVRFVVSPTGLDLQESFWGRRLPLSALRLSDARTVNLDEDRALVPIRKEMGTELSGYRAGLFRLQNGEHALLFLTDWQRVAYIPTTRDYSVLISVAEPGALLSSLRRATDTALVQT
jgi:hypothetical protein